MHVVIDKQQQLRAAIAEQLGMCIASESFVGHEDEHHKVVVGVGLEGYHSLVVPGLDG